jgi:hypothetical protein
MALPKNGVAWCIVEMRFRNASFRMVKTFRFYQDGVLIETIKQTKRSNYDYH